MRDDGPMANTPRGSVQIRADLLQRLKEEADVRGLSASRLAELAIERGLPQLPPVPTSDN
jgi:hypothetical protein